jgi:adenosylcobyric acid synthase
VKGGLMVCGTTSDAGKSHVTTGLCRLLARRGVRVAPFKAQNMALNSYVTPSGHEIGRSQGVQALAAGAVPEVAMNPILLKPTGDRTSQVIVLGRPIGHLSAAEYHEHKPALLDTVLESLADLRSRYDVVIAEGAGSPAEINLLPADIVNLRVAHDAGLPAIVVGDIDRGGVFAALYGTVALLPDHYRPLVQAFLINKFRGDPALLGDGTDQLEARCGVPTIGVLPWVRDVALDAEDSLALRGPRPRAEGTALDASLDVAVIAWPHLSNVTDVDAVALEPGVSVRLVEHAGALGDPDLVMLPGTKSTVADLEWFRGVGLDTAVEAAHRRGSLLLGVCGGYQMLGRTINDEVESGRRHVTGLGYLDVDTAFGPDKVTRQRRGVGLGRPVSGYEIHHGRTARQEGVEAWLALDDGYGSEAEGAASRDGSVLATSLHGLLESDAFRGAFLARVGAHRHKRFLPAGISFAGARQAQFDRLADLIEDHVDMDRLLSIIAGATVAGP